MLQMSFIWSLREGVVELGVTNAVHPGVRTRESGNIGVVWTTFVTGAPGASVAKRCLDDICNRDRGGRTISRQPVPKEVA